MERQTDQATVPEAKPGSPTPRNADSKGKPTESKTEPKGDLKTLPLPELQKKLQLSPDPWSSSGSGWLRSSGWLG